jgi:hypothetical protein
VRRTTAITLAGAAVTLAACGGGGHKPFRRVQLVVTSPANGAVVHGGSVEVTGSVSPADAQIAIDNEPVAQTGGPGWTSSRNVDQGRHTLHVEATARGRIPAKATVTFTVEAPAKAKRRVKQGAAGKRKPSSVSSPLQRELPKIKHYVAQHFSATDWYGSIMGYRTRGKTIVVTTTAATSDSARAICGAVSSYDRKVPGHVNVESLTSIDVSATC